VGHQSVISGLLSIGLADIRNGDPHVTSFETDKLSVGEMFRASKVLCPVSSSSSWTGNRRLLSKARIPHSHKQGNQSVPSISTL